MDPARLIVRFPRLYHVAELGSWPSILRHGLLSTSALLDLFEVGAPERQRLEAAWRPRSTEIMHPVHGRAVIRDQLPLRPEHRLAGLLDGGITPEDWYRTLNSFVFFWVDEPHLESLLGARAYRDQAHTVLTLDTARLVERWGEQIRLSSINSGAILRGGARRGPRTFRSVRDHDTSRVVELCVGKGVTDVQPLLLAVEDRWPDGTRT